MLDLAGFAALCAIRIVGRLNTKNLSPIKDDSFCVWLSTHAKLISDDADKFTAELAAWLPSCSGNRFAFNPLPMEKLTSFGDTADVLCGGVISASSTNSTADFCPVQVAIAESGLYFWVQEPTAGV